ncbi:hypothetical protein [Methanofollis sp. UBA420]|jgi:hypothetical protein|uniref:LolA family protein n=1 Tax=Methanofollis sp. UBA420 TaxID=1915514 RepID=UPI00316ACE01
MLEDAYEKRDLTYEGMETEDGRTVRVVEIAGNESLGEAPGRFRDPVYRIRASADAETGVLAGATFYGRDGRELVRFTFKDMVADPEVPPGTFSFVPPPGTEVTRARTVAVTPMVFFERAEVPEEVRSPRASLPATPSGKVFSCPTGTRRSPSRTPPGTPSGWSPVPPTSPTPPRPAPRHA